MKKLLLVSLDKEYVINILGTLTEEISEDYDIEVITDSEYLESYVQTPHKVDTLLIDESLLGVYPGNNQAVAHQYLITETDKIGANVISKYSGVPGIMKILGSDYLRSSKRADAGKTRIHDIVSVEDPKIKTIAAITIAKHLSAYGRKVLYISADNLQDFNVYMKDKDSFAGEEEALSIKAVIKGITGKLDGLVRNEDFDYIPAFEHLLSSYGMAPGSMLYITEEIQKFDIYDDIIVDHSFGFSVDTVTRLENSKSVVIISDQTEDAKRKLEKLLDNTKEVKENSLLVCYPHEDGDSDISSAEKTFCGLNICESLKRIDSNAVDNNSNIIEKLVEMKAFRDTAEALL